jgi:hypothetical protein
MLSNLDQNSVFSVTASKYQLSSESVDTCRCVGQTEGSWHLHNVAKVQQCKCRNELYVREKEGARNGTIRIYKVKF